MTETAAPPTPVEALEQILATGPSAAVSAIAEQALGEHAAAQAREAREVAPVPEAGVLRDQALAELAKLQEGALPLSPSYTEVGALARAAADLDIIATRQAAGVSPATGRKAAHLLERTAAAWGAAEIITARPIAAEEDGLEVPGSVRQIRSIPDGFEDLHAEQLAAAAAQLRAEAG